MKCIKLRCCDIDGISVFCCFVHPVSVMHAKYGKEYGFRWFIASEERFHVLVGNVFDEGQVCRDRKVKDKDIDDTFFAVCPQFAIGKRVTVQTHGIFADNIIFPPCEATVIVMEKGQSKWIFFLQTENAFY